MSDTNHVALIGDSIFDNESYVMGGLSLVRQLQELLPDNWRATLCAVDGAVLSDVEQQLLNIPEDVSHIVVSVGGNNALRQSSVFQESFSSMLDLLDRLSQVQSEFHQEYQQMLTSVLLSGKPTAVCTIYDSVPGMPNIASTALCGFNDVITREAARHGLPLIDLRVICDEPSDYSEVSPIEPSAAGGKKIAKSIVTVLTEHDFSARRMQAYL